MRQEIDITVDPDLAADIIADHCYQGALENYRINHSSENNCDLDCWGRNTLDQALAIVEAYTADYDGPFTDGNTQTGAIEHVCFLPHSDELRTELILESVQKMKTKLDGKTSFEDYSIRGSKREE